jgi:hypothetical protein
LVDLNLLRIFDILYDERNVTRAAARLFLTQSAVSHALARLRHVLADPLFMRIPSGLQPTERDLIFISAFTEASALLSAMDLLTDRHPLLPHDSTPLNRSLGRLLGFLSGCVVAAAAASLAGDWAWSLPAALAAVAIAVR